MVPMDVENMFDHTTIADRLRTVNRSDYRHQTGMVNRLMGQICHSNQHMCSQKDIHLKIC